MQKCRLTFSFFAFNLLLIFSLIPQPIINLSFGAYSKAPFSVFGPTVNDDNLTVEKVAGGLKFPTSMAFVGDNDILITEKNTGRVIEVINGQVQRPPALDVQVASDKERGLLGIDVSKHADGRTYAFVYYTESGGGTDDDDYTNGIKSTGNMLERYEYVGGKLINPLRLLDLPSNPGITNRSEHIGGKVAIGPDNNVYVGVGEMGGHRTLAQNDVNGSNADGTGGILTITQNGKAVPDNNIFGDDLPLSIYYAMGIRNSFGMDFDPLTGNLWDTENGPTEGDEINLVEPGFNSSWSLIQGYEDDDNLDTGASENDLVELGEGQYSDPKFVWTFPIGITAIKFLNSDKLGNEYANNMFAGDINNGLLYRLTLNEERDEISIKNDTYVGDIEALSDGEVDGTPENRVITFGQGFGGITDIQVGPDGYLYVLTHTGDLHRILPASESKTPRYQSSAITPIIASENGTQIVNYTTAVIVGIEDDNSYTPNPIEIGVGQTIAWINGDTISHTVTSGEDGDPDEGTMFDSGAVIPSQYYGLTFDEPGEFDYYCIYHPEMVGKIIVE